MQERRAVRIRSLFPVPLESAGLIVGLKSTHWRMIWAFTIKMLWHKIPFVIEAAESL